MRIGELAERAGVSTKTLRYYEDTGLIPATRRTASGYRDFDAVTLDRLAFIRAAQAIGLRLGEIREVVAFRDRGDTPCVHVQALLEQRAQEITVQIAELEALRAELDRLARRARRLRPENCDPTRVCHLIAPAPTDRRSRPTRSHPAAEP